MLNRKFGHVDSDKKMFKKMQFENLFFLDPLPATNPNHLNNFGTGLPMDNSWFGQIPISGSREDAV